MKVDNHDVKAHDFNLCVYICVVAKLRPLLLEYTLLIEIIQVQNEKRRIIM
jgi:hypothetical protein